MGLCLFNVMTYSINCGIIKDFILNNMMIIEIKQGTDNNLCLAYCNTYISLIISINLSNEQAPS